MLKALFPIFLVVYNYLGQFFCSSYGYLLRHSISLLMQRSCSGFSSFKWGADPMELGIAIIYVFPWSFYENYSVHCNSFEVLPTLQCCYWAFENLCGALLTVQIAHPAWCYLVPFPNFFMDPLQHSVANGDVISLRPVCFENSYLSSSSESFNCLDYSAGYYSSKNTSFACNKLQESSKKL